MPNKGLFSILPDDVILYIPNKLEDDPRDWVRISCVSTEFSSLIRNYVVCFKNNNSSSLIKLIPAPPGSWPSLYKLLFCCPGLLHSGIIVEKSTAFSHRDIVYDESETTTPKNGMCTTYDSDDESETTLWNGICTTPLTPHLATGAWNLSHEVGDKFLLKSQFKGDELYLCDLRGCGHIEKKHNYVLFRGFFVNFKQSRLWRTISTGGYNYNIRKTAFNCAFCTSKGMWTWHSSYCDGTINYLFGRAYVCENGHVSGAKNCNAVARGLKLINLAIIYIIMN